MGIDDIVDDAAGGTTIKERTAKFNTPELCPDCGLDNTEKVHYYWRCKTDTCETHVYINTQR